MIEQNRKIYLEALRNPLVTKGTTVADEQGRPVINSPTDNGFCAVGLIDTLFNPDFTSQGRRDALGLNNNQMAKIQQEWNDSSLTFPQIADLIESEMFDE